MGLFNFGKKKEEPVSAAPVKSTAEGVCTLKVLGGGCVKCETLLANTKQAVQSLGLTANVEYITDMEKIAAYGALMTPALVIDENVVSMGKVLKPADVEKLLHKQGY